MSGGHSDYVGFKIQNGLKQIADNPEYKERWPITCQLLNSLAEPIYQAEHDMDWAISGDIRLDKVNDLKLVGNILDFLLKACPDEWFPRGKWATIQAIQERVGGERK